jgi:glycerate dehydrogenase
MSVRIIVLDGGTLNPGDISWSQVETLGNTTVFDDTDESRIVERLQGAEIAVTNKVHLSSRIVRQLPALRFVAVTATGYDIVDVEAAREQGVIVSNVPSYGTDSVAQFAFAQILELSHHISQHDTALRNGQWEQSGAFSFWNTEQVELAGLNLGIIGFGRIGRRTAEIGHAFGMSIFACDQFEQNPPDYQPFAWCSAEETAAVADVIVLHCNLTPTSAGIVNRGFLERMKPSAFLINPARGALVDESALAEALNDGRLAGAAVDVVSSEPISDDNPLLNARNCIITPHMAWSTVAARERLMQATAENIQSFLSGMPRNVVNATPEPDR